MPGTASSTRSELIEQLAERARARLARELAPTTERFLRRLYRDVPPSDMADRSLDDLYGAGLALWRFGQARPAGAPRVRVYNPTLDRNGWRSSHTVVEIVNDDMPFLVDSVLAELQQRDCQVLLVVHPVLRVERDEEGTLKDVAGRLDAEGAVAGHSESFMQVQISQQHEDRHAELESVLAGVLRDVRAAVGSWDQMRERCRELIAELREQGAGPAADERLAEAVELLEWMVADRFTFLGYRESRIERTDGGAVRIHAEPGLGLLEEPDAPLFAGVENGAVLPDDLAERFLELKPLRIAKARRRSTVHRAVHLDTIAIKRFDGAGRVVGERLFAGLFTQEAYSQSPRTIPVLRRKIANIIERSGLSPDSHDARALLHILETYPRDELFQATEEELQATSVAILDLQDRSRVAFFPRRDPFGRFVSAIVYLPRDRYDTRMRLRLEAILSEAYGGEIDRFYTHLSDSALARLHFIVRATAAEEEAPSAAEVEAEMVAATRSWEDVLSAGLIQELGEAQGGRLALRYRTAFPTSYEELHSEQIAVGDIQRLEETVATAELSLNLYRPMEAQAHEARLKLYLSHRARLSDVVPMLENMGLDVIDEQPYRIELADVDHPLWIRDFSLQSADGQAVDLSKVRDSFHETLRRVWKGEGEDDGFNRLVLYAGLDPLEVNLLRAYARYLRQIRIPFSLTYMQATLYRNPEVARLLVELFERLFDPDRQEGATPRVAETKARIEELLDEVESLDEDRILRRFLNAVVSTVRTNFFQTDDQGRPKPYLSFKLDSLGLDNLPRPRPFCEIFVFSPRVEAIHLRGGKVARGGIRWSDRREDFRTEVLGLMKAQTVKNSVIVPVGAKGGFVVKRPPEGREELGREVRDCYRTMIRGLLDLTDNLEGDRVTPPVRVVRRDDDDPYLVVAADKGTATFSDLANSVSQEYGFWLGDAFASGGSAGYDHKKMGITARGAWESVKRHFRELGKEIQSEEFTVVGVGDMAGDVFGNGMLLSRRIQLVGAFNHQHIFVDPDPDTEVSWQERKRLFDLPRSSWEDYDPKKLSAGGAVFDRKAKWIEPSAELRALLSIEAERMTPNELISTLLRARVDLLWFGGIGSFVKASDESDADVDDRTNDAVRVDADELTARVVGEGANLGVTQRGRIEFSLLGGRINTDSIDNSAGVDCSDHEVNIKILLGEVEANGDLTRKRRDQLLAQMTDEVGDLVLRDNYLQTQAISVTHQLGAHLLDRVARFMRELERRRRLDRRFENLPDDDTVAERLAHGVGFARPEIAVLLSYAKLDLSAELLDSDLPDDDYLDIDLKSYFPKQIRKLYGGRLPRHRLRRELVATLVTNEVINRGGIAFVHEVRERTGASPSQIARAFVVSREAFDVAELWRSIEALDGHAPATLQSAMLADCGRLIERETVWFLRSGESLRDIGACIEAYRERVQELSGNLDRLITEADRRILEERARGLAEQGAPPDLARRIASLQLLAPASDIVRLARETDTPVRSVGGIYFAVGSRFGFDWLRRAAARLPTDSAWDKQAINAVVDDLFGYQTDLTRRVLESARGRKADLDLIESWGESRRPRVVRAEQLLAELQTVATPSLAMLAVANRQLKSLSA